MVRERSFDMDAVLVRHECTISLDIHLFRITHTDFPLFFVPKLRSDEEFKIDFGGCQSTHVRGLGGSIRTTQECARGQRVFSAHTRIRLHGECGKFLRTDGRWD